MNAIDIKNTAENEDMRLKTAEFSFKNSNGELSIHSKYPMCVQHTHETQAIDNVFLKLNKSFLPKSQLT